MRTLLFSLFIFLFSIITNINIFPQTTVSYTYDNAGNRIERNVIILALKSKLAIKDSSTVDTTNYSYNQKNDKNFQDLLGGQTITIYPNPTRGVLKIEVSDGPGQTTIGIYVLNLSGSRLIAIPAITSPAEIDLSSYPSGTYILKIKLGNKTSEWKIVKD